MVQEAQNYHKRFFKEIALEEISRKKLEEDISRIKDKSELREKVLSKGAFSIVVLGANEKPGEPSKILLELQEAIQKEGFPCNLGKDYFEEGQGYFEDEIQRIMLESNKLVIMVNSSNTGVVDESKAIRDNTEWKRKTLFFFEYEDCNSLIQLAKEKKYPIYFKFPIPFKGEKELKAKVLFGIYHCYMYELRRPRGDSDERGKE